MRELIMLRTVCLAVLLVPAALTGVSSAQSAPGMCQDCYAPPPAYPPPAYQPPYQPYGTYPAPVYQPPPELTRRIGIGLHFTGLAIANEANPDDPTELAGGGIQIRYRMNRRWELQLALDSLREQDEEGMPVGPELHSATVGVMLHLSPLRPWDVYLLGAIGGIGERDEPSRTSVERAESRGQFHVGVGLERRWRSFSINAELRGVGIAPAEDEPMTTTPRPGSVPPAVNEAEPDSGVMVTLGGTFFF
jgi:hypothetical protein